MRRNKPTISYHGATNPGLWRPNNEDCFHCFSDFFVVADGLGGHNAGELASTAAVKKLAKEVFSLKKVKGSTATLAKAMKNIYNDTNKTIYHESLADASLKGMGTTVAGLLFAEEQTFVASHAGDSRIYHLHKGQITQITSDHAKEVDIEADELGTIRRRYLTRAIGTQPNCEPDIHIGTFSEGDRFLLCTDGLSDYLTLIEIQLLMNKAKTAKEATDLLIDAALIRGGRDNITAIVVKVEEQEPVLKKT